MQQMCHKDVCKKTIAPNNSLIDLGGFPICREGGLRRKGKKLQRKVHLNASCADHFHRPCNFLVFSRIRYSLHTWFQHLKYSIFNSLSRKRWFYYKRCWVPGSIIVSLVCNVESREKKSNIFSLWKTLSILSIWATGGSSHCPLSDWSSNMDGRGYHRLYSVDIVQPIKKKY